jgi:hypothetical protein
VIALLREHSADLILSHEEFAAVPVAKAFGISAIFLTDWFLDSDHLLMKSLTVADEVLFMDALAISMSRQTKEAAAVVSYFRRSFQ